jgi:predicted SprT family Zn-dependent metalloprotease
MVARVARQIALDFGPAASSRTDEPSAAAPLGANTAECATGAAALDGAEAPPLAPTPAPAETGPRPETAQLEAALQPLLPVPVRVTLTDNRRTMISLSRRTHTMHVRLHHMFAEADHATVRALGLYLCDADRDAARQIGRYIDQHRTRIRRRSGPAPALTTGGLHHDLARIYAEVNAQYFAGAVDAQISWSRDNRTQTRSARSIKLGSYLARDRLIRVHPALDAAFVPRFFVEYIVYHEMLHHVVPARRAGRRRSLHGPEFRTRERALARFDDALCWERENLERLLKR